MTRAVGIALALTLLLPLAAAAPGEPAVPFDLEPMREGAARAGDAIAAGAAAAAGAAGDAAGAAGDALAAVGAGLASAFAAVGAGLASALTFLAGAASALAATTGAALSAALAAAAGALSALAALAASLAAGGASFVRAHPQETAIAAGSAAGLGGLAWLLKRLGWLSFLPLYSRLAPGRMLDNEARNRVYEHVRAHPGAHPSGIAEALSLGWGTVVYHLQRLEESKLVVSKTSSHRKCFFATGTMLGAEARAAVAAMSHDKAKLIVGAVRDTPGISQKEVAERVGMSQALASWHVKRLVVSGVLLSARNGRSNVLHVAEHVPRVDAPAVVAA